MSDPVLVSAVMRGLAQQRWGASRPVKLARELELRVSELPALERARLLAALTRSGEVERP
jgi:hypothetical protein